MLCSAISRLSLHPISRFGFVRNCGFSTRRSLALAHSLVEAKKFVVSRGKAFGRTPQSAKYLVRKSAFLRARELFASEKVLENQLQAQTNLKNYPVDDF